MMLAASNAPAGRMEILREEKTSQRSISDLTFSCFEYQAERSDGEISPSFTVIFSLVLELNIVSDFSSCCFPPTK